jgi:GNAT superfamily N-acetyltransferase
MAINIRTMRVSDLGTVLNWAAEEGWNPGHDDTNAFFAADPDGFFLAESDGEPIASISVVNHTEQFSFLGLYICRPAFRGRGIGLALWNHALHHAGARTIGLDGVPAQLANYEKSGFVSAGSTLRFEGELAGEPDGTIRTLKQADIPALTALDEAENGYRKERFLNAWLCSGDTRMSVVLTPNAAIEGFATVRLCRKGAKIGPVIAADAVAALRLIKAAAAAIDQTYVIVDVPAENRLLVAELEHLDMQMTFPTARMYRGEPAVMGPSLQAVATLELG